MLGRAILAEAAMLDGLKVARTQEYGPEAHLGATKGRPHHFKASDSLPEVHRPDFLLCLSRRAYLRYAKTLAANGARSQKRRWAFHHQ